MIERYSDHAANGRTFLAWVRTAIAIMAFGFLVQKFFRKTTLEIDAKEARPGPGALLDITLVALLLLLGTILFVYLLYPVTSRL
jgi:putative membrane protein